MTRAQRTTPTASEHAEQAALIVWADLYAARLPVLGRLYANPNGGYRPIKTALAMKAEGQRAGIPDLFLPVPARGCHGLYLEMKATRGRISPAQEDWLSYLEGAGYRAVVCWGWQHAAREILDYLGQAPAAFGLDAHEGRAA
jgi:hypothetical protein